MMDMGMDHGAMGADGPAVGLIAQALHEIEHRIAWLEHERLAGLHVKFFQVLAGIRHSQG